MTGLIQLIIFGKKKYGNRWSYGRKSLLTYISFSIGRFSFCPHSIEFLKRKDLIYRTGDFYSCEKRKSGIYKTYLHFFSIYKYYDNIKQTQLF